MDAGRATARRRAAASGNGSTIQAVLNVVDDVTRRDTRIQTLARFAVQAGRPVIEAA